MDIHTFQAMHHLKTLWTLCSSHLACCRALDPDLVAVPEKSTLFSHLGLWKAPAPPLRRSCRIGQFTVTAGFACFDAFRAVFPSAVDRPMVRIVSTCAEDCGVSTGAVLRHARCDAGQVFGPDSAENRRVRARSSGGGWTFPPWCNDRWLSSGVQTCSKLRSLHSYSSWAWLLTCPLMCRQVHGFDYAGRTVVYPQLQLIDKGLGAEVDELRGGFLGLSPQGHGPHN